MDRIQDQTATAQNQFTEGDPSSGTLATILKAQWLNGVQEELIKLIELAGIAPDANTWNQVWKSLQKLTVQRLTGTDTGNANAHVVNPEPAIAGYADGQRIVYAANAANTGAVTLNVNGRGVRDLRNRDGSGLAAGMIPAGGLVEAVYLDGAWYLVDQRLPVPSYQIRAWGNFDGKGFGNLLRAGGNIDNVERLSAGNYRVHFVTPMPHADYAVVIGAAQDVDSAGTKADEANPFNLTVNSFDLRATDDSANNIGQDISLVMFHVVA